MAEPKRAIIVYLPESYEQKLRLLAETDMISISAAGRKYLVMALDKVPTSPLK